MNFIGYKFNITINNTDERLLTCEKIIFFYNRKVCTDYMLIKSKIKRGRSPSANTI